MPKQKEAEVTPEMLGPETRVQPGDQTEWEKANKSPKPGRDVATEAKQKSDGEAVAYLSPRWPSLRVFTGPTTVVTFEDGRFTTSDVKVQMVLDRVEGVYREADYDDRPDWVKEQDG